MSIKGFHLIFITIAAIFCAGLGIWALFINETEEGLGITLMGIISLISSISLLAYGVYFRRKSRDIIV